MRFSEFLSEAVYRRWLLSELGNGQAFQQLNKNCLQYLKNVQHGNILYRGDKDNRDDISFIDTTNSIRTSRDYHNGYQLMMDVSEKLKDVPSRSKSLICTTNIKDAKKYHKNISVIVPFDGTKIAVSGEADFANTTINHALFKRAYPEDIGQHLEAVFYKANSSAPFGKEVRAKDVDTINSALSQVDLRSFCRAWSKVFEISSSRATQILTEIYTKDSSNFFTNLSTEIMTKSTLDIKCVDVGATFESGECWFSGKCIAIKYSVFRSMLNQLAAAGFPVHGSIL